MESRTGIRPRAVLCRLEERDRDTVRVVMEDVEAEPSGSHPWRVERLFTWRDLDRKRLESVEIAEGELAQLGLAVLARLVALRDAGDTEP